MSTTLMFQTQMLKEEMLNLNHAVQWAKAEITCPLILGGEEIRQIKKILETDRMPYVNFEEALHIAEISIARNDPMLIYVIKIQITNSELCSEILIKPIRIEQYVNKIKSENIIKCKEKLFLKIVNCNKKQ